MKSSNKRLHVCVSVCLHVSHKMLVTECQSQKVSHSFLFLSLSSMLVTLLYISLCQSHYSILFYVSHTTLCQSHYYMLVTLLHLGPTLQCQSHHQVRLLNYSQIPGTRTRGAERPEVLVVIKSYSLIKLTTLIVVTSSPLILS